MKCPRDNKELFERKSGSIIHFVCEYCHGILLENKELSYSNLYENEIQPVKTEKHFPEFTEGTAISPKSGELMKVVDLKGTKIDVCEKSGMVWIDGGELEVIKEKLKDKEIIEALKFYGTAEASFFGLDILLSSFFG